MPTLLRARRPRSCCWCLVDPSHQQHDVQAEALGLQLVAVPPPVAVARARGAGYSWSTTTVTDSGAREFWTALGFAADAELGRARYCEHMRAARDHPT